MDMSSYFQSSHSDVDETLSDSIGIESEHSDSQAPESKMLLKIILLALDDLTSRKRIYKISAILFFESSTFEYYLSLLGVDEFPKASIRSHVNEVIEQVREEVGMNSMHDSAWVMERLNRESRRSGRGAESTEAGESPVSPSRDQVMIRVASNANVLFKQVGVRQGSLQAEYHQSVLAF
ncbi:hypothetical protein [Marinobacterium sp. BA1]|uniref:hypothetical protein n=1 Tax=Marinobacterium sp. BA1 TaxID=3138931 RepID=UPI0032E64757